ncbi:MAG TPA: hypothetical protein VM265_00960 [Sphingomicrobium sp.]|nr:hypothetical protein [Sphingomicrobium sp.]
MRWTLGGLAAGLATAMLIIMAVEAAGNQIFPPPDGYDLSSGSAMTLPVTTLMPPVIGWFLGTLAGAWIAVRMSGHGWAAWAVGGFVFAASMLNLLLITHPLWMILAAIAAPLLGAWIGHRLAASTRRRPAA